MSFKDVKNVYDMIKYCKHNKKWAITYAPHNDLGIYIVFYYYQTPLLFGLESGDIMYMCDYTKENYITTTTCWYLSRCKRKFYPLHRYCFKDVIVNTLKLEKGRL